MNHIPEKVWSFYTTEAAELLNRGRLSIQDLGEGDLRLLSQNRREFRRGFSDVVEGNVLYRFAREMREGDLVLLRSNRGRGAELCRVTEDYTYQNGEHIRAIRFLRHLTPEEISDGAQREITYSSASPLFEVRHYAGEFFGDLGMNEADVPVDGTSAQRFAVRWALHRRFMEKQKSVTVG